MNVEYVAKEMRIPNALKERIEQKLEKIELRMGEKLFFRIKFEESEKDASVTCSIRFSVGSKDFNAAATTDDKTKSADEALAKLERQATKSQDRHDRKGQGSIRNTPPAVIEPADPDEA